MEFTPAELAVLLVQTQRRIYELELAIEKCDCTPPGNPSFRTIPKEKYTLMLAEQMAAAKSAHEKLINLQLGE